MRKTFIHFYNTSFFKRLILYGIIILLAYQLRGFANLFLMLFFVTFLMNELCQFTYNSIPKKFNFSEQLIVIVTYLILVTFLVITGIKYTPQIIEQTKELSASFSEAYSLNSSMSDVANSILEAIHPSLKTLSETYDFNLGQKISDISMDIIGFSYGLIKSISSWIINIFLMIILSFFFLIEKKKIMKFGKILEESKLSFVYYELKPVIERFLKAFGTIVKAQLFISLINTFLTITTLALLGFNNLVALAIMVFLFGLIPVAGAILSSIPLILIGFKMGGLLYVIYIIILIIAIHAFETYVLNPKIISNLVHFPIFVVLAILLISEHILGLWGLLYGLPLFVFFIESIKQE